MATRNIDGSNVDRYQGRITGTFDVDEDQVRYGEVVMAVVIVDVDQLVLKAVRGDDVGTYVFKAKDFAVVTDETMQKQLYHHLPHLQPSPAHEDELDAEDLAALSVWHDGNAVEKVLAAAYADEWHEADHGVKGGFPHSAQDCSPDPWPADTVVTTEQLDSVEAHDAEDGEVFSPADESRERARLVGAARDPILKRFLNGD